MTLERIKTDSAIKQVLESYRGNPMPQGFSNFYDVISNPHQGYEAVEAFDAVKWDWETAAKKCAGIVIHNMFPELESFEAVLEPTVKTDIEFLLRRTGNLSIIKSLVYLAGAAYEKDQGSYAIIGRIDRYKKKAKELIDSAESLSEQSRFSAMQIAANI